MGKRSSLWRSFRDGENGCLTLSPVWALGKELDSVHSEVEGPALDQVILNKFQFSEKDKTCLHVRLGSPINFQLKLLVTFGKRTFLRRDIVLYFKFRNSLLHKSLKLPRAKVLKIKNAFQAFHWRHDTKHNDSIMVFNIMIFSIMTFSIRNSALEIQHYDIQHYDI